VVGEQVNLPKNPVSIDCTHFGSVPVQVHTFSYVERKPRIISQRQNLGADLGSDGV
jgi:hypothetical protein